MKYIFFDQKNFLSNNVGSKISGIFNVIGENSNIQLNNTKLNKSNSNFTLNNSKFINYTDQHITINNINNSNITFVNGSYVCRSEKTGSLIQFPCPIYYGNINNKNTTLYPSSKNSISKNIISDGISAMFSKFTESTIYENLIFNVSNTGAVKIYINELNLIQYDINQIDIPISSLLEQYLPKNLNGYSYTFNFENNFNYTNILNFKNFNGGNIILNINGNISAGFYFENCKNIEINGNTQTENDLISIILNNSYIFNFNNCFNIKINNLQCKFNQNNLACTDVIGNINKYTQLYKLLICKNCNIELNNCKFSNSFRYTVYYIIAFNSKLLFKLCTVENTNLLLDQFSIASTNDTTTLITECISAVNNKNLTYSINENEYINNGLLNHFHTDYLVQNNNIPIGTIIAYQYWYRQYEYAVVVQQFKNKYGLSEQQISGIATIVASNRLTTFPNKLLPLCCSKDNAKYLSYTFLSAAYNALLAQPNGQILLKDNAAFENTIVQSVNYNLDDKQTGMQNILFKSMFFNSDDGKLRTVTKNCDGIKWNINTQYIDNHSAPAQVASLYGGAIPSLSYWHNLGTTCGHSDPYDNPFIYSQSVSILLSTIFKTILGNDVLTNQDVLNFVDDKINDWSDQKIKYYNTIYNNSTFSCNSTTYTAKTLIAELKHNELSSLIKSQSYSAGSGNDVRMQNRLTISQYFPIKFKIYMYPEIRTLNQTVNVLDINYVQGMVTFTSNSIVIGNRHGRRIW